MRVFGVVGWKNTGKTTLVEKITGGLVKRGYTVSTIKHAHHNFTIDQVGKDSFRHREAGASQVVVSSKKLWALISEQNYDEGQIFERTLKKLDPVNFVIVEGFKSEKHPKIECYLDGTLNQPLIKSDKTILGIVHNLINLNSESTQFLPDEVEKIIDFVIKGSIPIEELW